MASNAMANANAWVPPTSRVDSDFDRWLVLDHNRSNPGRDYGIAKAYIRNLKQSNTELPPIYSSYKRFTAFSDKLHMYENRIAVLGRMHDSFGSMCSDLPELRLDCQRELEKNIAEYGTLFAEMMQQINSVPLEKRRAAAPFVVAS